METTEPWSAARFVRIDELRERVRELEERIAEYGALKRLLTVVEQLEEARLRARETDDESTRSIASPSAPDAPEGVRDGDGLVRLGGRELAREATAVLRDVGQPMSLGEITGELERRGIGITGTSGPQTLRSALVRTPGLVNEGGRWRVVEGGRATEAAETAALPVEGD